MAKQNLVPFAGMLSNLSRDHRKGETRTHDVCRQRAELRVCVHSGHQPDKLVTLYTMSTATEEQEQNSVKPCIFSDIPSRVSQNVRNVRPAQPAEDPEEVTLCQRAPGVSGSSAAHIREVSQSEKG